MTAPLPFTVIGGYLGAGKTTLLNHLLTNTVGLRIAVLVNDFGSVNIDAELIRGHAGDTINLANGCMCCSLVNGFAQAIGAIRNRADAFDHMVIEASGVADPAKIAQYGQMYQLPLDGIVVVADAEQVRTQAENKYVGDTVVRQFAQADLILLNKIDLVSAVEGAGLRAWLGELAPGTPIIDTVRASVPVEVLLGVHEHPIPTGGEAEEQQPVEHSDVFETWTLERAVALSRHDIERFAAGLGEEIYRAKGFVWLRDAPERRYVYQQVGGRWSLEAGEAWNGESMRTRLVVIGRRGATSAGSLEGLLGKAEWVIASVVSTAARAPGPSGELHA